MRDGKGEVRGKTFLLFWLKWGLNPADNPCMEEIRVTYQVVLKLLSIWWPVVTVFVVAAIAETIAEKRNK
jgi:hypothetical protein